ncbi:MAG: TAXI family TRAP transporter solute-binding subunit [Bacillota bacterium]|nr:TAXI family TRAP transporter solute-binding subunit [Bacillota bacterium]MDD3299007.1 TAXI family TRAP transporter solute-binding subunit [Bacillota bacterium]MDD3851330.1 TAXI family TRAP transporter solute-binding subunit [Bacillota bacterium]MDD4707565.1 TAXI family TRAP transporter solute-binding subunit [Bacillota bacterium]
MNRKLLLVLMSCLLIVALVGCSTPATQEPAGEENGEEQAPSEQVFINIASGGTAGTYYPLAGGMADIWNKNIPGVNATAQSTGASVANINLLRDGEADVIMVQNDIAYYSAFGTEMFEGDKYADLRGLCILYPETIQIVTIEGKGIETVADLKGKRVAVGAAGSGTEANARQILEAAGITYDDITVQYLSFAEAANNLKDGNVDVAFVTAGHPTAAIQDIGAQHDVKLVVVEDDMADGLIAKYPFYTKIIVPGGTYSGIDEDIKTVAVQAMLAIDAGLDEDIAYNMLKTMYDNHDRMKVAHTTAGEKIKPETGLDGMGIELHPGADKYFNE